MNVSKKVAQTNEAKQNTIRKVATLNPNAAEFVPFALRATSVGSSSAPDLTARYSTSGTLGKAVLDRTESSVSNNSDEEARQFWRQQLPDDITPDFKSMGEDEILSLGNTSLAGLSLHDDNEASLFSATASTGSEYLLNDPQDLNLSYFNGSQFTEKLRFPADSYGEDPSSGNFLQISNKPWQKPSLNSNHPITHEQWGHPYGNSRQGLIMDVLNEQTAIDECDMNPVELLALQFPGFAAESLAEVYFANGGDLNLTVEMLTQLELQVDSGISQNPNSKTLSAPNLTAMDFPALASGGQNGLPKYDGAEIQQNSYLPSNKDDMFFFKSGTNSSRGAADFASTVRKLASQDSGIWKFNGNGSTGDSIGSSRGSHILGSKYASGHGKDTYSERLLPRGSSRAAPVWLDTGDAVANMYSEQREEARDHARLRNAYFEQARQAYLIGNKALAKELSVKGQLHNMHMKAAHGKAQESIYRQRNQVAAESQGNGRGGQERMIDLHGLHVSEAIHVLKHELSVLKSTARASGQRLQVYICVGTGHHTRGARTPARLPVSVQRYLIEEEGLDFSEPQPGLLRVVIY